MKNYFEMLYKSIYFNKIIVSAVYLLLALFIMRVAKTPVEKVVAGYIMIDIVVMFIMVGILQYYNTLYLKESDRKRDIMASEGLRYLAIAVCIFAIMFYASNYKNYGIFNHLTNSTVIIVTGSQFICRLLSYRDIYIKVIRKEYQKEDDFKRMYLFNNIDDLKIEYNHDYNNTFSLKSIEKNGIKVSHDFIYMNEVKYEKSHYLSYMKENDIKTLEDLTEEDKLLIAMINIS